HVDGALVLPGDHVTPATVVEVLLGEQAHVPPGPVGDPHTWLEPHRATALADAMVHLPVLCAQEGLVVAVDPLQRGTAKDTEVDGVGRATLTTGVETGVAHTDLGGHRRGHGLLPRGGA